MKPISRSIYIVPLTAVLLTAAELEALPQFKLLGDLPGGSDYAEARGVSADGSFVVGVSSSAASGVMNPNLANEPTEGFIWEAATQTMMGIGDLPGGRFSSRAFDVSADGQVVVGDSEVASASPADPRRSLAVRWNRGGAPSLRALYDDQAFIFKEPAINAVASATSISDNGEIVAGTVTWVHGTTFQDLSLGFYWWRGLGFTFVDLLPERSTVTDVTPDATFLIGSWNTNGPPTQASR